MVGNQIQELIRALDDNATEVRKHARPLNDLAAGLANAVQALKQADATINSLAPLERQLADLRSEVATLKKERDTLAGQVRGFKSDIQSHGIKQRLKERDDARTFPEQGRGGVLNAIPAEHYWPPKNNDFQE